MLRSGRLAVLGSFTALALACSAAAPVDTVRSAVVREDDGGLEVDAAIDVLRRAPSGECALARPEVGAACVTRGACHYAVDGEESGEVTLVACTCEDEAWACAPVRR